ncbi:MAG TPA: DNA methyltransferase, partial [Phycisphaerae bacterium]|nr:DNA methyltransferase [Phycisphaerae bacterium]
MNPVESWLADMRDIRGTGAGDPETSYYGPLENLFNDIGKTLKPKVHCVISLQDRGAGKPDGGFFTRNQFQKASDKEPRAGQVPERGAIEVKSPADDVAKIIRTEQVKRYVARYGLVLVTNYRDFLLLGHDDQGRSLPMEGYTLATSERAFWSAAAHPRKTADEHG